MDSTPTAASNRISTELQQRTLSIMALQHLVRFTVGTISPMRILDPLTSRLGRGRRWTCGSGSELALRDQHPTTTKASGPAETDLQWTTCPFRSKTRFSSPTHRFNPQPLHSTTSSLAKSTPLRFKRTYSTTPPTAFLPRSPTTTGTNNRSTTTPLVTLPRSTSTIQR